MKRKLDREHVIRILQHTESHNRAKEEQSMWMQKRKREHKTKHIKSEYFVENEGTKLEYLIGKENDFIEKPRSQETDENKWGHGGYWELYPELNREDRNQLSSSSDTDKSIKKVKKVKTMKKLRKTKESHNKHKKYKKRKIKKKHKTAEIETQISSESDYLTN